MPSAVNPAFYDDREIREPAVREADLFARLPEVIGRAQMAPGYGALLQGVDPRAVRDRAALAKLPIHRKSELAAAQGADLPFGGFVPGPASGFARLYTSPGPIFEGEGAGPDPWRAGRGLYAAGLRAGDIVLNTFSYHLTPGGFILDSGARAVGCAVIPAGPGHTETQLQLMAAYRPVGFCGTPDFLKILLDAADAAGKPAGFERAVVSGAAFPPSLQAEVKARGVDAYQIYATADLGLVAFETPAREGMVVGEDIILEIVRPGTGDPVAPGEVGEVVVTSLSLAHPLIRFALGDLSAVLEGPSPCGRTNTRIKGWMGRADQSTKVKGMFVTPAQMAALAARHAGLGRVRLEVTRAGETDAMTLKAETATPADAALAAALAETLAAVTKLKGAVELVAPGSLPNDGKVIADLRPAG